MVAQLLTLLDGAGSLEAAAAATAAGTAGAGSSSTLQPAGRVLVVAATNRPNAVSRQALRTAAVGWGLGGWLRQLVSSAPAL